MSELSFLKSALQQPKQLQGNSSSQSQVKITQPSSLTIEELTKMAQSQKEAQLRSNPNWFSRNNKRNIPGQLIKRSSLKLALDLLEEDDLDNFSSNLSSQTNKKILSSFRKLQPQDHDLYQNDFSNGGEDQELPPKKSIYDLNYDDDDLTGSSELLKRNTTDSINKDPMNFKNAFNSNIRMGLTTNSSIAFPKRASAVPNGNDKTNFGTLFGKEEPAAASSSSSTPKTQFSTPSQNIGHQLRAPLQPVESAVLIFGYDDSTFADILHHFSKFGSIMEDFNITTASESATSTPFKSQKKNYPIYIGKSWVKLTYDNPSSAIRACRENELNIGGQSVNIIPYSKEVLEKFLDEKISAKDDIGDSLNNLNFIKLNKVPGNFETLLHDTPIMDASKRNKEMLFNSSIKIKNGENLFVNTPKKPEAKNEVNKGNDLLQKASDILFGFNSL